MRFDNLIFVKSQPVRFGLFQVDRMADGAGGRVHWSVITASMMLADLLVTLIAVDIGRVVHAGIFGRDDASLSFLSTLAPATALVALSSLLGLYRRVGVGACERLRLRCMAVGTFILVGLAAIALNDGFASALVLGAATGVFLLPLGYYTEELVRNSLIYAGLWGARTAICADDIEGRAAAAALIAKPELGLRPVCLIRQSAGKIDGCGEHLELPAFADAPEATSMEPPIEATLFVTPDGCFNPTEISSALASLPKSYPVFIKDVGAIELVSWRASTWLAEPFAAPLLHQPAYGRVLKRALDLVLTVPAAILMLPVILAAGAAIAMADPGRIFFTQDRVGYGGRKLRMLKIRSMYQDAEKRLQQHLDSDPQAAAEWARHFKLTNDPRIIPGIGHFIRRYSLDELPQLWNVIRGDMSLVGPRPFPGYHLRAFDEDFQTLRRSVPPGLTGLWQISSRSDGDLAAQSKQDTLYIENWSFWLDLYILLQTLPVVVAAKGAK